MHDYVNHVKPYLFTGKCQSTRETGSLWKIKEDWKPFIDDVINSTLWFEQIQTFHMKRQLDYRSFQE